MSTSCQKWPDISFLKCCFWATLHLFWWLILTFGLLTFGTGFSFFFVFVVLDFDFISFWFFGDGWRCRIRTISWNNIWNYLPLVLQLAEWKHTLPPLKNRLEKREPVIGDSFRTGSGWATLVLGLEFPLSDPLLLVSRLARFRYCCLSSSVVNAAPVFLTAEDEPEDSEDALESELADRVDFFKIPPITRPA